MGPATAKDRRPSVVRWCRGVDSCSTTYQYQLLVGHLCHEAVSASASMHTAPSSVLSLLAMTDPPPHPDNNYSFLIIFFIRKETQKTDSTRENHCVLHFHYPPTVTEGRRDTCFKLDL